MATAHKLVEYVILTYPYYRWPDKGCKYLRFRRNGWWQREVPLALATRYVTVADAERAITTWRQTPPHIGYTAETWLHETETRGTIMTTVLAERLDALPTVARSAIIRYSPPVLDNPSVFDGILFEDTRGVGAVNSVVIYTFLEDWRAALGLVVPPDPLPCGCRVAWAEKRHGVKVAKSPYVAHCPLHAAVRSKP